MSASPANTRRFNFVVSALAIGLLLLGSCVWLGGELLRPIPPTRTPAPTPLPTQLGGGGGLIAFESRRDGNSEIYVMNADGTGQRNLTRHPADDAAPVWSPDGTRIAFVRIGDNQPAIFTIRPDGSGLTRLVSDVEGVALAWVPDGNSLLVQQFFQQGNDFHSRWVQFAADDSGVVTPLADDLPSNCFTAQVSPDATRIALLCLEGPVVALWVAAAHGSFAEMLARRVVAFGWSPDSQQLAYFSSGAPALSVLQLSTGEERIVREFSDLPAFGSASDVRWSPDGARLAVSLGVFDSRDLFLMWSDGSSLTRLTNGGINDAPRWSPDGNRLVYSHSIVEPLPTAGVITSTTSMHNLYALNVRDAFSNPAALTPVQLTTSGQDFNPQWQP